MSDADLSRPYASFVPEDRPDAVEATAFETELARAMALLKGERRALPRDSIGLYGGDLIHRPASFPNPG